VAEVVSVLRVEEGHPVRGGTVKVLVCGSRDWPDDQVLWDALSNFHREQPIGLVIHGGAYGADSCAGLWCERMDVRQEIHRPDYSRHPGHWAPKARNIEMLDEKPDLVIAFQRNGSRGTQHTINEARRRGIPVEVHTA